jgi:hypothetical protein
MATRYTDALRRDAVRIAISSGLTLAPPSHMLCMCCRATGQSIRSIDERATTGFIRFGCWPLDVEQVGSEASA